MYAIRSYYEKWFEKGAKRGDAAAAYQLAWMLMAEEDFPSAFKQFQTAAESGHEKAQLQCGLMELEGILGEVNEADALKWLQASADQGNETAALFTGFLMENSPGDEPNIDQALYYFRNSIMSQNRESYENFFGFLKDHLYDSEKSVEAMFMIIDEMLHWIPSEYLVPLGNQCWEHPAWETSRRWDLASRYFRNNFV